MRAKYPLPLKTTLKWKEFGLELFGSYPFRPFDMLLVLQILALKKLHKQLNLKIRLKLKRKNEFSTNYLVGCLV